MGSMAPATTTMTTSSETREDRFGYCSSSQCSCCCVFGSQFLSFVLFYYVTGALELGHPPPLKTVAVGGDAFSPLPLLRMRSLLRLRSPASHRCRGKTPVRRRTGLGWLASSRTSDLLKDLPPCMSRGKRKGHAVGR